MSAVNASHTTDPSVHRPADRNGGDSAAPGPGRDLLQTCSDRSAAPILTCGVPSEIPWLPGANHRGRGPAKPMTMRLIVEKTVMRGDRKIPEDYRPSEDEPFMCDRQRAYFRRKLLAWRDEILRSTKETLQHLHEESAQHPDIADRASTETERAVELRARDRQRKLIGKIDAALTRLDDGTYGYCEETGEPVSLKRLDARPITTLSVEAQERHERRERFYRNE